MMRDLMNRNSIALLITGIVVILTTIVVFALLFPIWSVFSIPSLIGMIVAEAILFGGLILLERLNERSNQIFLRSGFGVWLGICCGGEFALSFLTVIQPTLLIPWLLAIQLIIFAALIIGCGAIWIASRRFFVEESSTAQDVSANMARAETLEALSSQCSNPSAKHALLKLSDDIRFSDNTVNQPIDEKIDSLIHTIKLIIDENTTDPIVGIEEYSVASNASIMSTEALQHQLTELANLISERKSQSKIEKRGGF